MKINARSRTLIVKVVFYGPGLSGKTTNLEKLYEYTATDRRGQLLRLDTELERTLFFDFFPQTLGTLGSLRLRVHFFTVPGQAFYRRTRRAVLNGADGVVFVADSSPQREQANQTSLRDLRAQLDELGLGDIPVVFQWNKRDLPDAVPVRVLERSLNPEGAPSAEAVALVGEGVQLTQAMIMRETVRYLRSQGIGERSDRRRSEPAHPEHSRHS